MQRRRDDRRVRDGFHRAVRFASPDPPRRSGHGKVGLCDRRSAGHERPAKEPHGSFGTQRSPRKSRALPSFAHRRARLPRPRSRRAPRPPPSPQRRACPAARCRQHTLVLGGHARALALRLPARRPRRARAAPAHRSGQRARSRSRPPRAALRHPPRASVRQCRDDPSHAPRGRTRRRRHQGVHGAALVSRSIAASNGAIGAARSACEISLADRATQRALAWRRLPRAHARHRRQARPHPRPRTARRRLSLCPGAPRRRQRARGNDGRSLRQRAHPAWQTRRALPRQRLDLPRLRARDGLRAARRRAAPREALRPRSSRKNGALLAHAPRAGSRPHRSSTLP